jgi:hypothetical protein
VVWYYGKLGAFVTYVGLSLVFLAKESLVSKMEVKVINGEETGVVGVYDEATEKEKEAGIVD